MARNESTTHIPRMPSGEIDLVLRSTTSAWGPLACLGHEGGVEPGDWWAAFWWAMEQRWQHRLVEQEKEQEEAAETEQTALNEHRGASA